MSFEVYTQTESPPELAGFEGTFIGSTGEEMNTGQSGTSSSSVRNEHVHQSRVAKAARGNDNFVHRDRRPGVKREEMKGCPGNTVVGLYRNQASSFAHHGFRSRNMSPKSPESRKYWETVLDDNASPATGSTNLSSSSKEEKPYKCPQCPMRFKKRCNLGTHVSNVHENIRPYVCRICFRKFARKSNCVKHMKLVHQIPRDQIEVLEVETAPK